MDWDVDVKSEGTIVKEYPDMNSHSMHAVPMKCDAELPLSDLK